MTKEKLLELACIMANSILSNPINSSMCRVNKTKERMDLIKSEYASFLSITFDLGIEVKDGTTEERETQKGKD